MIIVICGEFNICDNFQNYRKCANSKTFVVMQFNQITISLITFTYWSKIIFKDNMILIMFLVIICAFFL